MLPRWAPRVEPARIRQLYAADASGLVDAELIDDVAWALYARCESIITVTAAEHGWVACPACGHGFRRRRGDKAASLACPACDWRLTWGEYLATYQHRQLSGGSAIGAFAEYVRRLPLTATPGERMLLIDWLLHQVHKWTLTGEELPYWRAAAVNLIEGNLTQIVALLEELAAGPGASAEVAESAAAWRERVLPRLAWPPRPTG